MIIPWLLVNGAHQVQVHLLTPHFLYSFKNSPAGSNKSTLYSDISLSVGKQNCVMVDPSRTATPSIRKCEEEEPLVVVGSGRWPRDPPSRYTRVPSFGAFFISAPYVLVLEVDGSAALAVQK